MFNESIIESGTALQLERSSVSDDITGIKSQCYISNENNPYGREGQLKVDLHVQRAKRSRIAAVSG